MPSGLGGFDQGSAILAEEFAPYVSDAIFIGNRVIAEMWEYAQEHNPGRYLALPIATAKNNTATGFGQYDPLPSGPQSIYSVASVPWSWYTDAVTIDYITARMVRGPNMRVDNTTTQIENAIGSLTDLLGQDTCSQTKGRGTPHSQALLGIYESCDNGTTYDNYANIARLGSNSLASWSGNLISQTLAGIGTALNDASRAFILRNYAACVVGDAAPTHIMGHQQVVSSYMFTMDSQIRLSPGDSANPYLGNPHLLSAKWIGDNHFDTYSGTVNTSAIAYNIFYVNANHTKYRYFGDKGFDYVPWIDTPGSLEKTSRYIIGFANVSDNPRLNGAIQYVNDLLNL